MEIKRKKIIICFWGMFFLRVYVKYFNLSFLVAFLVIVFLDFTFTIKKYRSNMKQIDYSISLMKDGAGILLKEIDACIFNKIKNIYLLNIIM